MVCKFQKIYMRGVTRSIAFLRCMKAIEMAQACTKALLLALYFALSLAPSLQFVSV